MKWRRAGHVRLVIARVKYKIGDGDAAVIATTERPRAHSAGPPMRRVMLGSVVDDPDPGKLDAAVSEGVAAVASFVEGDQLVFPMKAMIAMGRVKT